MENRFQILGCGMTKVPENWLDIMNKTQLVDRLYYIIEEGAGYIVHNEKHYFKKDHLYILSHCLNITYFVEDWDFCHAYIDYTDSHFGEIQDVIEIKPKNDSLLKLDVDIFKQFLTDNSIKTLNAGIQKDKLYQYQHRIKLILESFLTDIDEWIPQKTMDHPLVLDSIRYIHRNFAKDISVSVLSDIAHLSKNQYTRIFSDETGMTPYQYIKNYRMDVAVSLLRQGIAINEIAIQCGFLSTSSFTSSFKKQFGRTPSNYLG